MALLIAALVFVIMLLFMVAVLTITQADRRAVEKRLDRYVLHASAAIPAAKPVSDGRQPVGWLAVLRKVSQYIALPRLSRWMEQRLIQSGLPLRGSEFSVICLGSGLFFALLLSVLSGGKLLAALCGGALGYGLPIFFIRVKINRRARAFNSQLGDTLVLVANSLRTGYSFMQAIEMVAREMPRPISEEFSRVLKEMNLGISTEEALNNLAKRVDSEDLDLVVTAVLIQRQVGGNLAEVLDNIAGTIRERIKIKGQIKTLTAQGRISGIIIGMLPLCLGTVIFFMNQEYIVILFTHPMGKLMLAAGLISQIIGVTVIRKIVAIEV